jgi:spore coat protein U-like protein
MKTLYVRTTFTILFLLMAVMAYADDPLRKGWWKFDDGTDLLKAEAGFGSNLELVGSHQAIAGPTVENNAVKIGIGSHYKMTHGISPNGGGAKVNEFSLQIDFRVPALGNWYTFIQTSASNNDDGDCFIKTTGTIGVGATGYSSFALAAGEWYRLLISVNNGTNYRYYLDGQMLLDGTIQDVDGRFALDSLLLLFADNDGDDAEIDVAEAAIWDVALTTYQVQALGGFGHELPKDALQADGRWKFDNGDNPLEGYYGKDLQLVGSHEIIDGPIAANKAAHIDVGSYYIMEHGIAPNGGGAYVNEYSLQFDFRVDTLAVWRAFLQTNPGNSNDADCFINTAGQIGVGSTGYSAYKLIPQEWYRLIISVKNGDFYRYYLDGQLLLEGTKQDTDGRFAIENTVLLFADNDGDDGALDVAETAIWSRALDSSEVVQLGGYGHSLTDTTVTTGKLVGNWKFDDPADLLKAEAVLGLPLELVGSHEAVAGPAAGNGAVKIGVGSHYKMTHGIGANGGGGYVNQYSLMIDFKAPALGVWNALFQTDPANTNDGDCFIKPAGNIGIGATGYSTTVINAEEWYRLVISVKNGTHYQYYLDGQLLHNGDVQDIDGRFALDSLLLVFADEDGEENEIHCAELAIWNYPLSADEATALGGYHPDGVRGDKENQGLITKYDLSQNYPNPFNPATTITYAVPRPGQVKLQVFNQLGQQVATLVNEYKASGRYQIDFNSKDLPSGLYYYRLETAGFSKTIKMIVMK